MPIKLNLARYNALALKRQTMISILIQRLPNRQKLVEMVLAISIATDDRDLLGRGDVISLENSEMVRESEDIDEEFRGNLEGESSAPILSTSDSSSYWFLCDNWKPEQNNMGFITGT